MALDRLRIELAAVRHLDRARTITERNGERVVADHPNRGELSRRRERAVARGGEQQVPVDLVMALQRSALACTGERPQLLAVLENARCFEFEAPTSVRSR